MKRAVILSGGLDSTVLAYQLVTSYGAENTVAVTFNYGQRHSKEIECAKLTCKKLGIVHEIIDMESIGKQIFNSALMDKNAALPEGKYAEENLKVTVVPNRNMIMLSLATAVAIKHNCEEIYYGAHGGDHSNYPDCRQAFIDSVAHTLTLCHDTPVKLVVLYANGTKADIVKTGLSIGVPFEDTWSCYDGKEAPCGKCTTCNDRAAAFAANGILDETKLYKTIDTHKDAPKQEPPKQEPPKQEPPKPVDKVIAPQKPLETQKAAAPAADKPTTVGGEK